MSNNTQHTIVAKPLHTQQPLLWGLLHGLNDLTAGFMLAHFTYTAGHSNSILYVVIYSIIGFGGQLPLGFWVDYKKKLAPFANASLLLLPLAICLYLISPEAGIVVSGIASAFVHVTGGAICLLTESGNKDRTRKAGLLGVFTAPGVLGLTLGGVLGQYSSLLLLPVVIMTLLVGWRIVRSGMPGYRYQGGGVSELDSHDWIMLGILLIMCFRSFIFDVISHISNDFEQGALIIGLSAFGGKIIGGFIADRVGWKRFVYITLPLALLLFQFGRDNIYAMGFGIACLQSSVPVTLMLMGRSIPLYPATAAAMSLGTSIALAGLPLYMMNAGSYVLGAFGNGSITGLLYAVLFICWVLADRFLFKKQFFPSPGS